MSRIDMATVAPDGFRAVLGLEKHCRQALPQELYEIVKLRASIVNGCSYCTDMHSRDAIAAGIPVAKLFGVAAWHESPHFDAAQRAALRLTDSVTRLGEDGVPDEVWDEAAAHYDASMLGELVLAIATINVWNRFAISTRKEPEA
ncbi:carboxymuconolactone decarboxylase family protein [Brachybacterium phenoliresistens]|uniref:Alkylhydroperoxidase n=1 Tax=Brachybacterium phenoliresistens TaxID=396014 RepID=Z9JPV2_9MICO|nr:carboxymuconolactone decarboxylase family protein [Brachybacterium phenoliresistens]EWS80430.1 alkylhydroperoxidase [Brachybacterium phenoliresistens]